MCGAGFFDRALARLLFAREGLVDAGFERLYERVARGGGEQGGGTVRAGVVRDR